MQLKAGLVGLTSMGLAALRRVRLRGLVAARFRAPAPITVVQAVRPTVRRDFVAPGLFALLDAKHERLHFAWKWWESVEATKLEGSLSLLDKQCDRDEEKVLRSSPVEPKK